MTLASEVLAEGLSPDLAPGRRGCRFCGAALRHRVVDLGMHPLCESFVPADRADDAEAFHPLTVWVCTGCWLVQAPAHVRGEEIFREYAYFSSYSTSWLAHVRQFRDMIVARLELDARSQVVEVGSNDGYALQYFVEAGIPALGVDPASNVAAAAAAKGVTTKVGFFGRAMAGRLVADGVRADLLFGKNVLAQADDLNDFVAGLRVLLAPRGVITIEFPHVMRLIEGGQFDTIYHEHFSYFSLLSARAVFATHGLTLFDVEELPTHGGSLRIWVRHAADATRPVSERVYALLEREAQAGVASVEYYAAFAGQVRAVKRNLLAFLVEARRAGRQVVGYGAPGKGNTLLNYCGIGTDLLEYTVDRNPYKQGRLTPGTRIPIYAPERIAETRPDYVLILPWNLTDEISAQLAHVREWGGRLVVPMPTARVLE